MGLFCLVFIGDDIYYIVCYFVFGCQDRIEGFYHRTGCVACFEILVSRLFNNKKGGEI